MNKHLQGVITLIEQGYDDDEIEFELMDMGYDSFTIYALIQKAHASRSE